MVLNTTWRPEWAANLLHKADAWAFEKACRGDEKSARQLVSKLSAPAHALAWRMLGDSAEAQDVVQEAFTKLFVTQQFGGTSSLATYFHVIVTRLCLDRLRANQVVTFDLDDELQASMADDSQGPYQNLQTSQSASVIQQAMMLLKPRQRAALTLWAYQDATVTEIAKTLQIQTNAAHQLLHRAKINLRDKLRELGYVTE